MIGFGRKAFNDTLLKPIGGLISGMFFSNPYVDIQTTLFYQIHIDLLPFEYDGQQEQTCVTLDFIALPVGNYRDLENCTFNFPVNPEEGYVDGSIYIAGMHNPFDVTRIVFEAGDKEGINTTLTARLSFEDNSIKPTDITMRAKLAFGGIEIHCDELSELPEDELTAFAFQRIDRQHFVFDAQARKFCWR